MNAFKKRCVDDPVIFLPRPASSPSLPYTKPLHFGYHPKGWISDVVLRGENTSLMFFNDTLGWACRVVLDETYGLFICFV